MSRVPFGKLYQVLLVNGTFTIFQEKFILKFCDLYPCLLFLIGGEFSVTYVSQVRHTHTKHDYPIPLRGNKQSSRYHRSILRWYRGLYRSRDIVSLGPREIPAHHHRCGWFVVLGIESNVGRSSMIAMRLFILVQRYKVIHGACDEKYL